jgi:glycosyltransferase involved in cell wall biosynthesis
MRIGLVVTGGVDRSGRERVTPCLLWLVERLARRHDVHVFVLHYYPEPCSYPLLGATVHDIGRVSRPPGLRRAAQRRRLSAVVDAHGPFDVLHAYQGMPAIVAAPIARRLGVPLVASLESGELTAIADIGYGLQRRWFDRRAIATVLRVAARVTVPTAFMARKVPDGLSLAPIASVPTGVDASLFPLATRVDGPPWRLLRVASISDVKDPRTLLAALSHLVDRGFDVHLDLVGEDTLGGRIQALAGGRLAPRVTYHGFQPTDRLAAFYARAHLHIVSSRHEAAPIVMLEAAAAGLATVGTAVGYVADWQPDRAVAVPVQDPAALADAIEELLQDPARRARIATAAREWTLAHDADWTADQFSAIYAAIGSGGYGVNRVHPEKQRNGARTEP